MDTLVIVADLVKSVSGAYHFCRKKSVLTAFIWPDGQESSPLSLQDNAQGGGRQHGLRKGAGKEEAIRS